MLDSLMSNFSIIKTFIMKLLINSFLLALGFTPIAYSQSHTIDASIEVSPYINETMVTGSKANWDLDFSSDITTSSNSVSQAAIAFFNNEFWTSQWSSDTLFRYSATGAFIQKFSIPGISGTRSITTDGSLLYLGTSGNTIYIVDPSTATLSGTISSAANVTARFLTYDPTLDGGNGGFWIGNFNTDIESISMNGTLLSTIPNATHGLSGMYGAAYDGISFGGPYLWVFHQGGGNNSTMTALDLTTGTQTTNEKDVFPDISSTYGLTTGLAGGAFLTTDLIPGETTLLGLVQGNPVNVMVGYELDLVPFEDVALTSARSKEGYKQIPESQIFTEAIDISYTNNSTISVDTLYVDVDFYHDGNFVSTSTLFDTNVAVGASGVLAFNFLPQNGIGAYEAIAVSRTHQAMNDSDASNDTTAFIFNVNDSIFARDDNSPTGTPYSVSPTDSAIITSVFEIMSTDTVTGIWIRLESPVDGDSTYGIIYNFDGTTPTSMIATSEVEIISSSVNEYYLKFQNETILTPGKYAFGCFEAAGTEINLSQSNNLYTTNTNFVFTGGLWSEDTIPSALFIRPIMGYYVSPFAHLDEINAFNYAIYPNPTNELIWIESDLPEGTPFSLEIIDMNGKVMTQRILTTDSHPILVRTNQYSSGFYLVQITTPFGTVVKRLVKE